MKQNKYLFSYNLPSDNHASEKTTHYIDVRAERFYGDSVYVTPLVEKVDLIVVKNWNAVLNDIERISKEYFKETIRQEKISEAREILALAENPILERLELETAD